MYWLENREAVPIKKSGRKKKEVDSETRIQIIEIHKEQKLGARRLEKVLEFKYHKHVHTMRFMKFCLKRDWRERTRNLHARLGTHENENGSKYIFRINHFLNHETSNKG